MARSIDSDTAQMKRFAARCKTAAPYLHKRVRSEVRQAGNLVRDEARAIAPSKKIAKTIRTSATTVSATVKAGNANVPEAALLEGDGTPGTFRHPLFGNKKKWYVQARQPYLHPALEANREKVEKLIGGAAHDAVQEILDLRAQVHELD